MVTAALSGVAGAATVIWPWAASPAVDSDDGRTLDMSGIALRSVAGSHRTVLVPSGGVLHEVEDPQVTEAPLGGMAREFRWVRVRVQGSSANEVAQWTEVERRSRLALASELVGVARRILEVASDQVSTRRQFGRTIGSNQSVRFRMAESYAETVGAASLVTAAWEDGSPSSAAWAKAVAGTPTTPWPSTPCRSAVRSGCPGSTRSRAWSAGAWLSTRSSGRPGTSMPSWPASWHRSRCQSPPAASDLAAPPRAGVMIALRRTKKSVSLLTDIVTGASLGEAPVARFRQG